MYVVKYDVQSMVKLIKCIEQHPLLWNTNNTEYSIRSEQDRAWKIIAKEVEESESLCRDRWRSIRACFGRHLRNQNANRKPYYLAEYLDFLLPFTASAKNTSKRNENGNNTVGTLYGSSGEDSTTTLNPQDNTDAAYFDYDDIFDELYIDVYSDNQIIEIPIKRRRTSFDEGSSSNTTSDVKPSTSKDEVGKESEQKTINSTDPDIVFFKSILTEVARMSQPQKLQFKQSVLSIINKILYVKEDHTEQEVVDKPDSQ